ncbi:universal stress protein [Salegentibacter sp.]|uniref:universal stress protein n=1 Tax=Salegentibacter sp. TaxID=1903072 RepID=UPI00356257E1
MAINVLILTDYSAHAYNAARYALNLPGVPSNFFILHAGDSNKEGLEVCIEKLRKEATADGHKFHSILKNDNLIDATRKVVAEKDIDLIVMGASGRSSDQIKGIGTNTYNVLRKVKCPVLTVTENQEFKPWENLFFPIDYSVMLHGDMLEVFKKLPLLAASVFNVWEINKQNQNQLGVIRQELNTRLSPRAVNFNTIDQSTQLGGQFWKDAKSSANLVVLMARNLKISDELLLHPPIKGGAQASRPPILILHG